MKHRSTIRTIMELGLVAIAMWTVVRRVRTIRANDDWPFA